ncbi:MAG: tRNA preQ1(34) S-adenosylmethionine ribosyltransferase-isomerase QueA [Patescibacteria group bacterium]
MKLSDFDYHLPKSLIAQKPSQPRDRSRLLVVDRETKKIQHKHFYDLPKFLRTGDVLVFNDTKVFPARLRVSKKPTGGRLEIFLLRPVKGPVWECLIGGKVRRVGQEFVLSDKDIKRSRNEELEGEIIEEKGKGIWLVRFNKSGHGFWHAVNKYGQTPTPPYIKTPDSKTKQKQYQTVYANKVGSVAAPTAGFHFTKKLIKKLKDSGIKIEFVTLHVGYGTFQPVKETNIKKHKMHAEWASISPATLKRLRKAKKDGRRIIAVGTTSVRVLETIYSTGTRRALARRSQVEARASTYSRQDLAGWIDTFIYPSWKFKAIDGMITNFHLPQSSLLMLVAAFMGMKMKKQGITFTKDIYKKAVNKKYRFYSFGDGMLIK